MTHELIQWLSDTECDSNDPEQNVNIFQYIGHAAAVGLK